MSGYPGWHWTVSVAKVEGSEPTALEVELMPGNGALLAPDWVPWSDRLAEYQAAQEQLEAASADDMAIIIEDLVKLMDGIGANLKRGRYPDKAHSSKIAAMLRKVADELDA
jgi:hypothetical protein